MIGQEGSYFGEVLALKGHYIITGNTNDNFCNDLLQITDIRGELHRHLLEQNYDAVFFFDYTNMLYCYDYKSFRILSGAIRITEEGEQPAAAGTRRRRFASEGPFGSRADAYATARGQRNGGANARPQQQDTSMRLNMGSMGMQNAWQQVIRLLRDSGHRCALVLSNINSMQTSFSVPALQALQELTAGSHDHSSIVIYLFRGSTVAESLDNQTVYGTHEWNIFFQSVLRPLMETDDPYENRVISLRTPNESEVRNLLRCMQGPELNLETVQINRLAEAIAYGCARENRNLKQLRAAIQKYVRDHPNCVMNMDNYCRFTGLPRNTTALQDLERLIGLDEVKTELRKNFSSMKSQYSQRESFCHGSSRLLPLPQTQTVRGHLLNVCLMGNPGTGKSEIARLLGRMYYEANLLPQGHFVPRSAGDLVSGHVGQTAINVRQAVQEAMGGVLLIDEAYALLKNEHGREAIDQLVNDMTTYEGQFAVVIAGYPRQMTRLLQANEGLASRFGTTFQLPDYTPEQMRQIFDLFLENDPDELELAPELEQQMATFCSNWASDHDSKWGNAREAAKLVARLKRNARDRLSHPGSGYRTGDPIVMTAEDLPVGLRKHLKPKAQNVKEALEQIQGMIGLTNVKVFLRQLADSNLWEGVKGDPGRFVFHGPPGTGKTHVARLMGVMLYLLGVLKRPYVYEVAAQDLLRPDPDIDYGVNRTPTPQEILQAAVENARGGIFFIDEAHQLADTDAGHAVLRALVPIVEHPDIRRDTCFILAGYSTEMRNLLREDAGLARRFPEANRIRFDSYTAHELTDILESMAKDIGQNPEPEYLKRTCLALSKYLETPEENYGNAGFIRDTYLPESMRVRLARMNRQYAGDVNALVDREIARNVSKEEKNRLTAFDLPGKFQVMAGPLGLPVPEPKDAWGRIQDLVGKEEIKQYLQDRREAPNKTMFYDNFNKPGLHFAVVGSTGTGRHTVIRAMAALWKQLGLLSRDTVRFAGKGDLEAGFVGQTAIKTSSVVDEAMGGCLTVEYPSAMLPKGPTDNTFGPEALGVINGAMSNPLSQISIVLLDTKEGIEELFKRMPSIKSRISRVFDLDDLTHEEMFRLFQMKTGDAMSFTPELAEILPDFFLNWVSQRGGLSEGTHSWANGVEVDQLVDQLISRWNAQGAKMDPDSEIPKRLITRETFPEELHRFMTKTRADKDTAIKELEKMTGLTRVKEVVRSLERESRMNPEKKIPPGFYAFVGYPGTGKTTVARLMGGVLRGAGVLTQGHVIERTAQQFIRNPGEFADALKLAKNGILFIDEAPQLAEWDSGRRVIQELLTTLENTKITGCTCIILAGYPKEMAALIASDRGLSSRFGESIIVFDNYSPNEMLCILDEMASNAHKIPQINAPRPLVLDEEFRQLSLAAFKRVANSQNKDFGNARYVRNHLRDCYKRLLERLDKTYPDGNYPEEERWLLTEADMDPKLIRLLEQEEQPALIRRSLLSTEAPGPITDDNKNSRIQAYYQCTVLLDVSKENGEGGGTGTGTIISRDGHVLTCAHVVRGMDKVRAKVYCPGAVGGDFLWFDCEVLQPINEICDMALLKMKGTNFPYYMPLRPADQDILETEQTLLPGYPLGGMLNGDNLDTLKPSYFEGKMSSCQIRERNGQQVTYCYIDTRGLHGNSGSPVVSEVDGRVIGVFSGSVRPRDKGNVDELNLFFPIQYFWKNFTIS